MKPKKSASEKVELPDWVKVGSFWYAIEAAHTEMAAAGNYGSTEASDLLIKVDEERPRPIVRETLLHEIIHAAETILPEGELLHERQCKALSRLLFQVFTENPETRKFIFEED